MKIYQPGSNISKIFANVTIIFENNFNNLLDTVGTTKEELLDTIKNSYQFPGTKDHYDINNNNEFLVEDVLCSTCVVKVTEKYLSMLICCQLSKVNNKFKSTNDNMKTSKRIYKAKKLNIERMSKLLAESYEMPMNPKKKCLKITLGRNL